MRTIREQRDLDSLLEPRLLWLPPLWLRRFATGLIVVGAGLGGGRFVHGLNTGGDFFAVSGGAISLVVCLSVLVRGRPDDWRSWVNLAATSDGLNLTARAKRVVFVPWRDVVEIGVKQVMVVRGGPPSHPRLTLRLPEDGWSRFGKDSGIEGSGAVRHYLLPSLGNSTEALVAQLKAFRDAHASVAG